MIGYYKSQKSFFEVLRKYIVKNVVPKMYHLPIVSTFQYILTFVFYINMLWNQRQVKPHREASTSSNSGTANRLPEWAKPLENIYKMKTNSGGPIRNAVLKAIECSPPVQVTEKLWHSISKEVFKSNNASRTKVRSEGYFYESFNGDNGEGPKISTQIAFRFFTRKKPCM